jgi:hypothetical protein
MLGSWLVLLLLTTGSHASPSSSSSSSSNDCGSGKGKGGKGRRSSSSSARSDCDDEPTQAPAGFSYPPAPTNRKEGRSSPSNSRRGLESDATDPSETALSGPSTPPQSYGARSNNNKKATLTPRRKKHLRGGKASNTEHPLIDELRQVSTKYYVYDDCAIIQCDVLESLHKQGPPKSVDLDHAATDAKAEAETLEALMNHSLRTLNPDEASLFVIPLPIAELLACGCQWEDCSWFEDAFHSLTRHPLFPRKYSGHNHLLISQHWVAFNPRFITQFPGRFYIMLIQACLRIQTSLTPFCLWTTNSDGWSVPNARKCHRINALRPLWMCRTDKATGVASWFWFLSLISMGRATDDKGIFDGLGRNSIVPYATCDVFQIQCFQILYVLSFKRFALSIPVYEVPNGTFDQLHRERYTSCVERWI